LISSKWINEWIKFVQKNDNLAESPPGPINNSDLELILVIEDRPEKLKKNVDYFMLTKEVWDFFFNIYGGGPTITVNNSEELNITAPSELGSNKFEL
jgi:hypothetical protein